MENSHQETCGDRGHFYRVCIIRTLIKNFYICFKTEQGMLSNIFQFNVVLVNFSWLYIFNSCDMKVFNELVLVNYFCFIYGIKVFIALINFYPACFNTFWSNGYFANWMKCLLSVFGNKINSPSSTWMGKCSSSLNQASSSSSLIFEEYALKLIKKANRRINIC